MVRDIFIIWHHMVNPLGWLMLFNEPGISVQKGVSTCQKSTEIDQRIQHLGNYTYIVSQSSIYRQGAETWNLKKHLRGISQFKVRNYQHVLFVCGKRLREEGDAINHILSMWPQFTSHYPQNVRFPRPFISSLVTKLEYM